MGEEDKAGRVRGKFGGKGAEVGVDCWVARVFRGGGVDFLCLPIDFIWRVLVDVRMGRCVFGVVYRLRLGPQRRGRCLGGIF